jgi:hypothetical protein
MKSLVVWGLALCCLVWGTEAALSKVTEDNWRDLLHGEWMVEL